MVDDSTELLRGSVTSRTRLAVLGVVTRLTAHVAEVANSASVPALVTPRTGSSWVSHTNIGSGSGSGCCCGSALVIGTRSATIPTWAVAAVIACMSSMCCPNTHNNVTVGIIGSSIGTWRCICSVKAKSRGFIAVFNDGSQTSGLVIGRDLLKSQLAPQLRLEALGE